jgi:hypothetical protein
MKKTNLAGLLLLPGCAMDGQLTVHRPSHVRACNGPVMPAPCPPPVVYSAPAATEAAPVYEPPAPPPVTPVEATPMPTGWRPVRSTEEGTD